MSVLVIGGGIMGQSIALELKTRGVDVSVLEKAIPGAEASTAAAGMLAPQLESHAEGPMLDLALESRAIYAEWAADLKARSQVDCGFVECGAMQLAFNLAEAMGLQRIEAWQKKRGLQVQRVPAPAFAPTAVEGLQFPDEHQVEPQKLMRALSVAASAAGVGYRRGTVRGLVNDASGRVVGADVDGETLRADTVVLAAGSWSSLVAGAKVDARVVKPMRGQMIELQTRAPLSRQTLKSARGYLVFRPDGRVVAGSTMEDVGYDKQVTAAGLQSILSMALELCPALADAPVTSSWAGLRPYSEDGLPLLGEGHAPGLLLATGHFRNGILLAPITARVIADLVTGRPPAVDLTPFRYNRFPI